MNIKFLIYHIHANGARQFYNLSKMSSTLHLQGGSQCYNPSVYNDILSWWFDVYNSNGSLIFSDFWAKDGEGNSE